MEFILVKYSDRREVFIDDLFLGFNHDEAGQSQVYEVPKGTHTIRLGGDQDHHPLVQDIDIHQTSRDNPLLLEFQEEHS